MLIYYLNVNIMYKASNYSVQPYSTIHTTDYWSTETTDFKATQEIIIKTLLVALCHTTYVCLNEKSGEQSDCSSSSSINTHQYELDSETFVFLKALYENSKSFHYTAWFIWYLLKKPWIILCCWSVHL